MAEKLSRIQDFFARDDVEKKFKKLLGERSSQFLTSVMSVVNDSERLAKADPKTIYTSALVSATLNLPIDPNLGFAYIIPYNNKGNVEAQFQMWYKGFIQLALRSDKFKTISATPVYQWQLVKADPLQGYEFDWDEKESDEIIGYASYFSLLNGFDKTLYMTVEEVKKHWKEYSQSYKKWFWQWNDNFDSMAIKTVIKLLLSKYAPLSIEMETAVVADQWVIRDENMEDIEYVDNDQEEIAWVDADEAIESMKSDLSSKKDNNDG